MIVKELITKIGFSVDENPLHSAIDLLSKFKGAVAAVAVAAAGSAVVGGIASMVGGISELGRSIADNSARIGVSKKDYQELGHIAALSGTSIENLSIAVLSLSKNMDSARNGNKTLLQAFKRLGVSTTDANGNLKNTKDFILELVGALGRIPAGAERTALSLSLLGDSGAGLQSLMEKSPDTIRELGEELHKLGSIISDDVVLASGGLGDEIFRIRKILQGFQISVTSEMIVPLVKVSKAIREFLQENQELIKAPIEALFWGVGKSIEFVSYAINKASSALKFITSLVGGAEGALAILSSALMWLVSSIMYMKIGSFFSMMISSLGLVKTGFVLAGTAAKAFSLALLSGPSLAGAAIAALLLLLEDLYTYFSGGDSFIGKFIEKFKDAGGVVGWFANTLDKSLWAVRDIWENQLVPIFESGMGHITKFIVSVEDFMTSLADNFSMVWTIIKAIVGAVSGKLGSSIKWLVGELLPLSKMVMGSKKPIENAHHGLAINPSEQSRNAANNISGGRTSNVVIENISVQGSTDMNEHQLRKSIAGAARDISAAQIRDLDYLTLGEEM